MSSYLPILFKAINKPVGKSLDMFFKDHFECKDQKDVIQKDVNFDGIEYWAKHLCILDNDVVREILEKRKWIQANAPGLLECFMEGVKGKWSCEMLTMCGPNAKTPPDDIKWKEVWGKVLSMQKIPCCKQKEGCTNQQLTWNTLQSHLLNDCLHNANFRCPHCKNYFTKAQKHDPENCLLKTVACPTCGDQLLQHMVSTHTDKKECVTKMKEKWMADKVKLVALEEKVNLLEAKLNSLNESHANSNKKRRIEEDTDDDLIVVTMGGVKSNVQPISVP